MSRVDRDVLPDARPEVADRDVVDEDLFDGRAALSREERLIARNAPVAIAQDWTSPSGCIRPGA
jgi:hypothetical protein